MTVLPITRQATREGQAMTADRVWRFFSGLADEPLSPEAAELERKSSERELLRKKRDAQRRAENTVELCRLLRITLAALLGLFGAVSLASIPAGLSHFSVVGGISAAVLLALVVTLRGDFGWLAERIRMGR